MATRLFHKTLHFDFVLYVSRFRIGNETISRFADVYAVSPYFTFNSKVGFYLDCRYVATDPVSTRSKCEVSFIYTTSILQTKNPFTFANPVLYLLGIV